MFEQELDFINEITLKVCRGEEITNEDRASYYTICKVLDENNVTYPAIDFETTC